MACLSIIEAFLYQHLAHGETGAVLLQPLAMLPGIHLRLCRLRLIGVVHFVAVAITFAAILP